MSHQNAPLYPYRERELLHFEKAQPVHPIEYVKPLGILGRDWHVLDDHVGVDENVIEKEDSFFLNAVPVGEVSVLIIPS